MQQLRIVINNRPVTIDDSSAEDACPKCATAINLEKPACAKCGLSRRKMAQYARTTLGPIVDALSVAWKRATLNWEVTEHHDEVLRLVIANNAWAWAATKYRNEMRRRPNDSIGEGHLKRVEKGLVATTLAMRAPREKAGKTPYRGAILFLAIGVAALVLGGVWAKFKSDPEPTDSSDQVSAVSDSAVPQ